MEKCTRSLFATKRSVGWAVLGTNNVSWGLIFPKTTRAMDVLPDLREPMSTMRGARSARSLSPSEGVAGHRSRLAYMFLRARWPLSGAAEFCARARRCSSLVLSGGAQGAHGVARRRRAAGLCVVLLVSVAVLTRRLRADLQRLRPRRWAAKNV